MSKPATPEEMISLGASFAKNAVPGDVFALVGDLGAGKTHWTKGFVAGLGSETEVTSPTFGLIHEYRDGKFPIHHFDFYRLAGAEELLAMGWDEYVESGGIVIAEWADRFPELLPEHTRWLEFSIGENGGRIVTAR